MNSADRLSLFSAYGVELEYMIVDRDSLDVRPLADQVLKAVAGDFVSEVEIGDIAWSNELVLHVIEFKTNGPAPTLEGLVELFQGSVSRVNELLEPANARLMPSAMHPWMEPFTETRLWPHEYDEIYATFNRIFDCRGHGWSNLQSIHLNLPFRDAETDSDEFGRLHAAVRVLLPLLPALAASSPVRDGVITGLADSRLEVYAKNSIKIPSVGGKIIPEAIFNRSAYEADLLGQIYRDLSPYDPEGILRFEWANARGAIARFDRYTIEIRLIDIQECPKADLAVVALISGVLQALVDARWTALEVQQSWSHEVLAEILWGTIAQGESYTIDRADYLQLFGMRSGRCTAQVLWMHLLDEVWPAGSPARKHYGTCAETILEEGTLSRRILRALGSVPTSGRLFDVYQNLAECLAAGRMFHP